MRPLTAELAKFVTEIKYEDLPAQVIQSAKYLFLDFLGCVLGGLDTTEAQIVRKTIGDIDNPGQASIWGTTKKGSIANAILANTTAGEGRDFSAGPMASAETNIIPAAAALAEHMHSDGRNLLLAIVSGVEIQSRVLSAMSTQTINRHGFYHQAVVGPFGATAACGQLFELDAKQLANAFGIAGSLAGGLFGWVAEGVRLKTIQVACKATESILACNLAKQGFPGFSRVLESDYGGLLKSFSHPAFDAEKVVSKFGELWFTSLVPFKPYPCCRWTHPYIDCVQKILNRDNLRSKNVASVTAYGIEDAERNVMQIYKPATVMEANFSLPFVIAVALIDKQVTFAQFTPERWDADEVIELAQKVTFARDPRMDERHHYGALPPFILPGGLTVKLNDGRTLSAEVDHPKGMPENPMSESEIVAKFKMQASAVLSPAKADQIVSAVMQMEQAQDVSKMVELFH